MTSAPVTPAPEAPALSEPKRIIDTLVAPSKTFTDIRRSAAWWGPFLVAIITTLIFVYSVDTKVGFRKVTEHQIEQSPRATNEWSNCPARSVKMQLRVKQRSRVASVTGTGPLSFCGIY